MIEFCMNFEGIFKIFFKENIKFDDSDPKLSFFYCYKHFESLLLWISVDKNLSPIELSLSFLIGLFELMLLCYFS